MAIDVSGYSLPLYLYPDEQSLDKTRRVNFDPKIRRAIEVAATDSAGGVPDEVAILITSMVCCTRPTTVRPIRNF